MVFLEKKFLHQRIQKEDVSIDFTATIDIPEDAVKHYGSMVTLRWSKSLMFTLSIIRKNWMSVATIANFNQKSVVHTI